jgi:hypothetical protein
VEITGNDDVWGLDHEPNPDLEQVAETCWRAALAYHRTVDEGESMDVALEGMDAAQKAGSERWTIVCRAEALFDGLFGTYPRFATSLAWAPEARTMETATAVMRGHVERLEGLDPEASWICRAYLACLLQGNGQDELAQIEWERSLEQARSAGSRFAEEEILCLQKGGMWDDDCAQPG